MSEKATKRAKTGEETPREEGRHAGDDLGVHPEEEQYADLLSLLSGDLGGKVLSYAAASDLCAIDAVSKRFGRLTNAPWAGITKKRFGMTHLHGKEGWKIGVSFLREPIFVRMVDSGDYGYGGKFGGSPIIATNGSIVAVGQYPIGYEEERTFPDVMMGGIAVRDAYSLNYFRTMPSPIENWRVAICGRVGSEIIVTSTSRKIAAQRGNDEVTIDAEKDFEDRLHDVNGIPLIGCETHLFAPGCNSVEMFRVENDATLISHCKSATTAEIQHCEFDVETSNQSIAWGPDSHFVTCHTNRIIVWKFDAESEDISPVQQVSDVPKSNLLNVALAEDYIIGSHNRKLHVWDRRTGEKVCILCDVDEEDELEMNEDNMVFCLLMSCHGNILVSTSHIGCALCVWDLTTGKLLKRHNQAEEQGFVKMMPDGLGDTTGMAYLYELNAFVCMEERMYAWLFPTDDFQRDMAESIQRREEGVSALPSLEAITAEQILKIEALEEKVRELEV
ncbi:hypothetical protein ACHAXT_000035 [Thalassiosira profunda]